MSWPLQPYNIHNIYPLIHDFDDFPTPARLQETSRLFSLDLSAFCKAVAKVDTTREMAVAYAKECVTGRAEGCEKTMGFAMFFWGLVMS